MPVTRNPQYEMFITPRMAMEVMVEELDDDGAKRFTYNENYVVGQVSNLGYGENDLTVSESQSLEKALDSNEFKVSKAIVNRQIECTLKLPPINLKDWAMLFQNLEQYESMFGRIMSPEVAEKFRQSSPGSQF